MSKKILVADDDVDVQEMIKMALAGTGYEVITANNGTEALNALETDAPDLVILDVMMAEPDEGFYVAQKMRKQGHDTPIIMLTSVSDAVGWDYDADDEMVPVDLFLNKPVKPDTIREKVEALLSDQEVES